MPIIYQSITSISQYAKVTRGGLRTRKANKAHLLMLVAHFTIK